MGDLPDLGNYFDGCWNRKYLMCICETIAQSGQSYKLLHVEGPIAVSTSFLQVLPKSSFILNKLRWRGVKSNVQGYLGLGLSSLHVKHGFTTWLLCMGGGDSIIRKNAIKKKVETCAYCLIFCAKQMWQKELWRPGLLML